MSTKEPERPQSPFNNVGVEQPEVPLFEGLPSTAELTTIHSLLGGLKDLVDETTYHAHWQLRDGIVAWREWLFLNQRTSVLRYNTITKEKSTVLRTDDETAMTIPRQEDQLQGRTFRWNGWAVVCLKVFLDRYLVIGGLEGALVIYDLEEDKILKTCVLPGIMINSMTLHICGAQSRLLISQNTRQHTFQVYTFPAMSALCISMIPNSAEPTLINGVALSPDNHWLAMAGDAPWVYIYEVLEEEYRFYEKLSTLGGNNSVSWNLSSDRLAVACEAGCCQVFSLSHDDPKCFHLEATIWNLGEPSGADIVTGTGGMLGGLTIEEDSFINQSHPPPISIPQSVVIPNLKQAGTVPLVKFSTQPSHRNQLIIFQSVDFIQVIDLCLRVRHFLHLPSLALDDSVKSLVFSGGDISSDGGSLYIGTTRRENPSQGLLFKISLNPVPCLLDLALSFVRRCHTHWSLDECAQRLPHELLVMIYSERTYAPHDHEEVRT